MPFQCYIIVVIETKINKKGVNNMSLKDKAVWLNGSDYIELESVGSTLTSENKVFPTDCNETPPTASDADEMMGVHIYDLDDEWFTSLSSDDLNDFFEFVENSNPNMAMVVYEDWKANIWCKWLDVNNVEAI